MSREDLTKLSMVLNEKMSKIEDKKSKEYLYLDSENRMVDMVLNPSTPELWLNPEITDFFSYDNSKDCKDVKVLNYKHKTKWHILKEDNQRHVLLSVVPMTRL